MIYTRNLHAKLPVHTAAQHQPPDLSLWWVQEEPLARATRAEAEPEHENLSRVVVCLEGATGIGKTRLLESTIEMGRDMGFLVLEGFWKFGAMPRLSSRHPIVAIEMQNWIEVGEMGGGVGGVVGGWGFGIGIGIASMTMG